jgi:hypothetical protein
MGDALSVSHISTALMSFELMFAYTVFCIPALRKIEVVGRIFAGRGEGNAYEPRINAINLNAGSKDQNEGGSTSYKGLLVRLGR